MEVVVVPLTLDELKALVEAQGHNINSTVYDWDAIDEFIRNKEGFVTVGEVAREFNIKYNIVRNWLERQVAQGKYLRYPPRENGSRAAHVVYIPADVAEKLARQMRKERGED